MHNFTPTDVGVFLESKCVKWVPFSILKDYTYWYGCSYGTYLVAHLFER